MLNARFVNGQASNDLSSAGVLIHQIDMTENPEYPWKACPQYCHGFGQVCGCHFLRDRLSSSLIFAEMPRVGLDGGIPIYSEKAGGVIYHTDDGMTRIFCAFAGDAGTRARVCDPPGASGSCTPGCTDEWHQWCNGAAGQGDVWCNGDPWSPDMLSFMLEGYRRRRPPFAGYNEFVIDAEHFMGNLPNSIEAFWYPLTDGCADLSDRCQMKVKEAHVHFLQEYRLDASDVPLLGLRPDNWDEPFVALPPATADEVAALRASRENEY